MKLKLFALTTLPLVAIGWAAGCGGNVRPTCLIGHGPYAMKYTPKAGAAVCADHPKGELIIVQKYNPPADTNPTIVMKVDRFWGALYGMESVDVTSPGIMATGDLSAVDPDSANLCTVPTMTAAGIRPGAADEIKYEFSNVKFYVTALTQGAQFSADLKLTLEGCTTDYTATALWPVVTCAALDEDHNPIFDPVTDEPVFDETTCPSATGVGRPDPNIGSQVNPDFVSECHHDIYDSWTTGIQGVCAISAVPSIKAGL